MCSSSSVYEVPTATEAVEESAGEAELDRKRRYHLQGDLADMVRSIITPSPPPPHSSCCDILLTTGAAEVDDDDLFTCFDDQQQQSSRHLDVDPCFSSSDDPLMMMLINCTNSSTSSNTMNKSKVAVTVELDQAISGYLMNSSSSSSSPKAKGITTSTPAVGLRINPAIKRIRKSVAKKVVCVPAPSPANITRPSSGEVVPCDLWAWRKYGQKPIKGSPYPRGYYRCSSSKGCLARKQVERSRTDPNMLVITYTSDHNHPWPTQRNALAGSTRSHQASKNNNNRLLNSRFNNNNNTSSMNAGDQQLIHGLEENDEKHMIMRYDERPPPNQISNCTYIKEELGNNLVGDQDDSINHQLHKDIGDCDNNQLQTNTTTTTTSYQDNVQHWCSHKIYRPTIRLQPADEYLEQSQDDFFAEFGKDAFSYFLDDWPLSEQQTQTLPFNDRPRS